MYGYELPVHFHLLTNLLIKLCYILNNSRTSVDVVLNIATKDQTTSSSSLTRQTILALGGMSLSLRETNPELADELVDALHNIHDQLNGIESLN